MKKQIEAVIANMKSLTPTHISDAANEIFDMVDAEISYRKDVVNEYKDALDEARAEMKDLEKELREAYRSQH